MNTPDSPSGLLAREPEPTRQRILEAARAEFAAHGLAGARIDRIARSASASKERLYAYYRHKAELFNAVLELNLIEFARAVSPEGRGSLPDFAAALYDHTVHHPDYLRMIDWARLERQDAIVVPAALVAGFHDEQVRRIAVLQQAGLVDTAWEPGHLAALVFGIVTSWIHEPSSAFALLPEADAATLAARRASVIRAVERLVAPAV